MNEKGQVVLLLILVMTVALAIGLSIVQKSLVDVSTSSKVEQSSRAFSAAEAGIEKALQGSSEPVNFSDSGSSIKEITGTEELPCVPGQAGCIQTAGRQVALEYPPLAKEDAVQVWLASPKASLPNCAGFICYTQPTLDIYWGNSQQDKAALELTLVYFGKDPQDPVPAERNRDKYRSYKWYLDNLSVSRNNGFEKVNCQDRQIGTTIYTCNKRLDFAPVYQKDAANKLMLIRARLLYNNTSQPFAAQATGTCGAACSLPPQARSITSTGVSGETQRKVRLFQQYNVVPPYFDYAIFSAAAITK